MNDKGRAALAAFKADPRSRGTELEPLVRTSVPRFNPTFAAKLARERDQRRAERKRQRAARKANR